MTTKTTTKPAVTYKAGTIYHLPPGSLRLERNIRDAKPDYQLVESVAAVGVLQPIVAVDTGDGALLVRYGHRRTLAAVEAKSATVPVYVTGVDALDDPAEVARIVRQHDENTHRAGLTTAEEVGVVAQLSAFGLTADEIADGARIHKDKVKTALTVSKSKMAVKSAEKWDNLTLDQVAAIAEFEDDKEAVASLVKAAKDGRFTHAAQRMRDDRKAAAAKAECIAKLEADGVKVIERPSYDDQAKDLERLVDATTGKNITPKGHAKCPGHVAWTIRNYSGNTIAFKPEFGCSAPTKHGHKDRYGSSSSSSAAAADMTDEQRAAAKAERKLVIENNKAWASAEVVRREWVSNLAKTRTAPSTAAAFIAIGISDDASQFHNLHGADTLTEKWLGTDDLAALVSKASDARALVIALVRMLAVYEVNLDQRSWRADGTTSRPGRYLQFLASAGYPLSEVEEFAISKKTA